MEGQREGECGMFVRALAATCILKDESEFFRRRGDDRHIGQAGQLLRRPGDGK